MSLRGKLLLVALSILVLPWAGWQTVRQMEMLLRQGQEQALLASAEALARGIAARPGRLPATEPGWFVHRLAFAPRLDGDGADWQQAQAHPYELPPGEDAWLQLTLARAAESLHVLVVVADTTPQRGEAHWPGDLQFDRVQLRLRQPGGDLLLRLANSTSGELKVAGSDGLPPPVRIEGWWREHAGGYSIELALPQAMAVDGVGIEVRDVDAAGGRRVAGTLDADGKPATRPLHGYVGVLEPELLALAPPGMRATLVDADAWVLARAGALASDPADRDLLPWRRALYRALLFRDVPRAGQAVDPSARRLPADGVASALAGDARVGWRRDASGEHLTLIATVPVRVGGRVRAALQLERSNSEVLLLTDRAFTGLVGISLLAFAVSGGALLWYASRLATRIRRLRDAAEHALDREGRVTAFPRTRARDEIGDLSRSFASLLDQVAAYTGYLRSLSAKLSHELNTPLAIVRTSLDNLDHATLPDDARPYLARARDGVERMGTLVRTMSEVTRIEHAIAAAEAEQVDLVALLADCGEGYRALLAPRRWHIELPPGPVYLRCAPDLVVQALDKLVDNARGFCPPDGWVRLALARDGDGVRIALANQGPRLPAAMRGRLFDSLVSVRERPQRAEGAPHLGFGLHIVRLVAELHDGRAEAADLPDGDGVEFTLRLQPLPPPRS